MLCTFGAQRPTGRGARSRSPVCGARRGPARASGSRTECSGRDGGPASAQRGSGPVGGVGVTPGPVRAGLGVTQPILGPAPRFLQEGFGSYPTQKGECGSPPATSRSRAGRGGLGVQGQDACAGGGVEGEPHLPLSGRGARGQELRGRGPPSPPLPAAGWQRVLSLHPGQGRGNAPWVPLGPVRVVLGMSCCCDCCAVSPPVPSVGPPVLLL